MSILKCITIILLTTASLCYGGVSPSAIELSQREKTALSAVQDNNSSIDEAAFWMLREKLSASPEDLPQKDQADFAAYYNIVNSPDQYRAEAINIDVSVFVVEELTAGESAGWPVRRHWPAGAKMWRMSCLVTHEGVPHLEKPLIIYSTTGPRELTSGKGRTSKDSPSAKEFPAGVRFVFTGIFYKNLVLEETDGGKKRTYPAIIAYRYEALAGAKKINSLDSRYVLLGVLIAILAGGFFILRKHVSTIKKSPRRKSAVDSQPQIDENESPYDDKMNPDIDLINAVEEYRKEHE